MSSWRSQGLPTHPEDQNEEENEEKLKENERNYREMRKDWGNYLILSTQEWEAGYGPGYEKILCFLLMPKSPKVGKIEPDSC